MTLVGLAMAAVGAVAILCALFHPRVAHHLMCHTLAALIAYPKTSALKRPHGKPHAVVTLDEVDEEKLLGAIVGNINLCISDPSGHVAQVMRYLLAHRHKYFLDQLDNIIITKMGAEVLVVQTPPKEYDRSLCIDITEYGTRLDGYKFAIVAAVGFGIYCIHSCLALK